ncbi:PilZ domain-containing protein [Sphingomonas sp.]|uniref:PilZ domain-containing protein n=1 Tax=Sphingomonas sp. TaxID=28214 RepID=UPI0025F3729C|nr:PilZ domain-containing protein [Sphingomonas sp.]
MNVARDYHDLRHAIRSPVAIPAQLRVPGAARFDVALLDLSATGFRCETFYGLTVGERVFVTIPTFAPFEAVIAWRDVFTYGCAFHQSLHEAVVKVIVSRFAPSAAMR